MDKAVDREDGKREDDEEGMEADRAEGMDASVSARKPKAGSRVSAGDKVSVGTTLGLAYKDARQAGKPDDAEDIRKVKNQTLKSLLRSESIHILCFLEAFGADMFPAKSTRRSGRFMD